MQDVNRKRERREEPGKTEEDPGSSLKALRKVTS
jgi:hypothetical protein